MRRTKLELVGRVVVFGLLAVLTACTGVVAGLPDTPSVDAPQTATPQALVPETATPPVVAPETATAQPLVPETVTPPPAQQPASGPVLTWQRMGGIAGFCDGVEVFANGEVLVTTCEGEPVDEGMLSSEQKAELDAWFSRFASFDLEETDPATADAMTVRVAFTGAGDRIASDVDRQAIRDFASAVHAGLTLETGTIPASESVVPRSDAERAEDAARDALAARLGVETASMELVEITEHVWNDGCLGLARPDEMCTMALVPGFRVVVDVNGTPYAVRTNRDGRVARIEGRVSGERGIPGPPLPPTE
jgi:hypothetical protein